MSAADIPPRFDWAAEVTLPLLAAQAAGAWLCPCCGEKGEGYADATVVTLPPLDNHVCDRTNTGPFGVWR